MGVTQSADPFIKKLSCLLNHRGTQQERIAKGRVQFQCPNSRLLLSMIKKRLSQVCEDVCMMIYKINVRLHLSTESIMSQHSSTTLSNRKMMTYVIVHLFTFACNVERQVHIMIDVMMCVQKHRCKTGSKHLIGESV